MLKSSSIVCLCGSKQFPEASQKAEDTEKIAGNIVLRMEPVLDEQTLASLAKIKVKEEIDVINLKALEVLEICDELLVLNIQGYSDDWMKKACVHATALRKKIRFFDPDNIPKCLVRDLSSNVLGETLNNNFTKELDLLRKSHTRIHHLVASAKKETLVDSLRALIYLRKLIDTTITLVTKDILNNPKYMQKYLPLSPDYKRAAEEESFKQFQQIWERIFSGIFLASDRRESDRLSD